MTHVHIVTEPEHLRWILLPLSEALADALPHASIGKDPNAAADVNFFNNYELSKPVDTLTMALFTHAPDGGAKLSRFTHTAREVDWCFAMCEITKSHLPAQKTSILPTYPTEKRFYKDLTLGVVGRKEEDGRKRMGWVEDLKALEGIEVRRAHGQIPDEEMPKFYDEIDYLVVLARNEGGPQPVIEALARKRPVIAPNVGYCWDYPVIKYRTKQELITIIRNLVIPVNGWELSANIVLNTLAYLKGETDEIKLTEGITDPRVHAASRDSRSRMFGKTSI